MPRLNGLFLVLAILIVIGAAMPVFHYWYFVGRVPGVTPLEARQLQATAGSTTVLVDVRSPEQFKGSHIEGAENWPYPQIMALRASDGVPERFRGRTVLLVCDSGVLSAETTQRLRELGVDGFNVKGGIQAWVASANRPGGVEVRFRSASGETVPAPFKNSPLHEQFALVGAVFLIKPLYMLLSLVLVFVLVRLKSADLAALRWGLTFFFLGEAACALNIVFFTHSAYLLEFFHMYGMVLSFAFVTYAVLEALDVRIIGYSDPSKKCAVLSLCRQCIKYVEAPCALKWLFYFLIPSFIILAFIPLVASTHAVSYNTQVLRTFYNYSHPVVYQLFEIRYSPVYAIILLAASLAVLLLKQNNLVAPAKMLFAAGMGPLAFAFLRLVFVGVFQDNLVWFSFWEELTELIYITGVGFILWIFRRGLFPARECQGPTKEV